MKNDGKEAERAFTAHWDRVGHCQRLRDKRDLMGLNGGKNVADFSKPSDFLVSSPTQPLHYAEVKSTNHESLFEFKCIRPAQRHAALMEAGRGNKSYRFYIFSYARSEWYTIGCELFSYHIEQGRKSLRFEELTKWQR
jgi:hypothetical protein